METGEPHYEVPEGDSGEIMTAVIALFLAMSALFVLLLIRRNGAEPLAFVALWPLLVAGIVLLPAAPFACACSARARFWCWTWLRFWARGIRGKW